MGLSLSNQFHVPAQCSQLLPTSNVIRIHPIEHALQTGISGLVMYVDFSITFDSVSLVKLSVPRYGFGTGRKNGSSHFSTVVANVFTLYLPLCTWWS